MATNARKRNKCDVLAKARQSKHTANTVAVLHSSLCQHLFPTVKIITAFELALTLSYTSHIINIQFYEFYDVIFQSLFCTSLKFPYFY